MSGRARNCGKYKLRTERRKTTKHIKTIPGRVVLQRPGPGRQGSDPILCWIQRLPTTTTTSTTRSMPVDYNINNNTTSTSTAITLLDQINTHITIQHQALLPALLKPEPHRVLNIPSRTSIRYLPTQLPRPSFRSAAKRVKWSARSNACFCSTRIRSCM